MYVSEGMTAFRVYWLDMSGNSNSYFDEGLNKDDILNEAEENIKRQYLASFTVVGLEERINKRWVKIDIDRKWYPGR
jgi:hypothetical protein